LKIGYVRLHDSNPSDETASLKAQGCHVVRAEECASPTSDGAAVLASILEFVGRGDQLVVCRLDAVGQSARDLLDVLDKLERKGASLLVSEPEIDTASDGGRALRAVLEAVAELEPTATRRRRGAPALEEIRALQNAGLGPVEIARRLGVSRMTVWRKMRVLEPVAAD